MTTNHPEGFPKILIADDDEGTIALLSIGLEKEGYEVLTAFDGQEALEKAEEHRPDLILLDIMMPKLDGYSLLLRLKGAERTNRIPIFVISAQPKTEHEGICQTLGALEFIKKPYRMAEVIQKVTDALAS